LRHTNLPGETISKIEDYNLRYITVIIWYIGEHYRSMYMCEKQLNNLLPALQIYR